MKMAKGEAKKKKKKTSEKDEIFPASQVEEESEMREGKTVAVGNEMVSQSAEMEGSSPLKKKKRKEKKVDESSAAPQVAEGKEERTEEGGKTVVVGIRMDSQSRELLTWALVKAASPGDTVVALHVLASSSCSAAAAKVPGGGPPASVLSLAQDLGAMLAVYEGFCNLKQIELKLKICNGSSISKVLAGETKAFAASKLVLGVTKGSQAARSSSISVAKNCAKKLPSSCEVTALSDGKIVFQREAADNKNSQKKKSKNSSKLDAGENGQLFCLLPIAGSNRSNAQHSRAWPVPEIELNGHSVSTDENSSSIFNGSTGNYCALRAPESDPLPSSDLNCVGSLSLVQVEKDEPLLNLESVAVKEMPEAPPGWPFLRRRSVSFDKHKISVLQWAKWLPGWQSSVLPDLKSKKSDSHITLNQDVPVGAGLRPLPFLLSNEGLESLQEKYSSVCRIFTYEELTQATSNFSHENLIGKGGSSSVYKGRLSSGKELAVKILKPSEDAVKEFLSEIEILTTLHHKNIIPLLGFCFENPCLILVYDYVSRGTLEQILHEGKKNDNHVLGWPERYKIAIGVGEALDYLHGGGSTETVIHRDVKSSNILLSEDFNPQLSDFGLAKSVSASNSQLTCSDIAGTFGYLAPEYVLHGKVDEKIDVYAFGVVLLELISGRKPISTCHPKGQESLILWAKPIFQDGEYKRLIDPCLGNEFNCEQAERMMLASSLCIRRLHQARPAVSLVLKLLRGDDEAIEWAKAEVSSRPDVLLDEVSDPNIRNHLNLAFLDVEDDSISTSSTDQTIDSQTDDYLQWRWRRSSSLD